MTTKEQVLNHKGMVVLRDIDWGREFQFWLLDMQPKEFEEWWGQQESFDTFLGTPTDLLIYEVLGETPPPIRKPGPLPGRRLSIQTDEDMDLWMRMSETKAHYFCQLCCDCDSYLKAPDGRTIHHKGYRGDEGE